jgi:hypothetical protein
MEPGFLPQGEPVLRSQPFDQPETGIVARALVLLSRVAQTDNEFDRHLGAAIEKTRRGLGLCLLSKRTNSIEAGSALLKRPRT